MLYKEFKTKWSTWSYLLIDGDVNVLETSENRLLNTNRAKNKEFKTPELALKYFLAMTEGKYKKRYIAEYRNEDGKRVKEKVTGARLDEIKDKKLKLYMASSLIVEAWED